MYESLDSVTGITKRSGLNYMKTRLILMRSLVYVIYQFLYKENNA